MICQHCGEEFELKRTGPRQPKYCGDECRHEATGIRRAQQRGGEYTPLGAGTCERCGKSYERKSSNAKYCDECKPLALKEKQQERHARIKAERECDVPARHCERCGNDFYGQHNARWCDVCRAVVHAEQARERRKRYKAEGIEVVIVVPDEKRCGRCGESKPPSAFSPQVDRPTGLTAWCKECLARYAQEKRKAGAWKIAPKPPAIIHQCKVCGEDCPPRRRLCSDECVREHKRRRAFKYDSAKKELKKRRCRECNKEFVPEYGNKRRRFCSDKCVHKYGKRITKATRRARIKGNEYERIDPIAVFERDGWRCHICGRKAPQRLRGTTDDRAPELDHIVPLSKGGAHTWNNVACAHRRCNFEKSDKEIGQMLLSIVAEVLP